MTGAERLKIITAHLSGYFCCRVSWHRHFRENLFRVVIGECHLAQQSSLFVLTLAQIRNYNRENIESKN